MSGQTQVADSVALVSDFGFSPPKKKKKKKKAASGDFPTFLPFCRPPRHEKGKRSKRLFCPSLDGLRRSFAHLCPKRTPLNPSFSKSLSSSSFGVLKTAAPDFELSFLMAFISRLLSSAGSSKKKKKKKAFDDGPFKVFRCCPTGC
jgi:hypothetical protein